jgi:TonB family protein
MNPNPMMPPPQRRGWWSRNWKWFVPVSLVSLLVFGGLIIALIVTVVMGSVKSSVPYTRAMTEAKTNPELVAELGTPIEAGWFVTGSISTSGSGSNADLSIPISGPKGSGTVHVVASKSPFAAGTGDWKITVLEAKVNGGSEVINLNAGNTGTEVGVIMNDSAAPDPGRRYAPPGTVKPVPDGTESKPGVPGGVPENVELARPPGQRGPISGGVLNGRAISLPKPPYPAAAKAVGAKGSVIVEVTLDENGRVITAKATEGHPLLRAAAEAAAREARFTPTKLSGQAVQVSGVITYNFTQ